MQKSKTTIWLAASAGRPPHSFVFSLSQWTVWEGFQITAEGGKTGEREGEQKEGEGRDCIVMGFHGYQGTMKTVEISAVERGKTRPVFKA